MSKYPVLMILIALLAWFCCSALASDDIEIEDLDGMESRTSFFSISLQGWWIPGAEDKVRRTGFSTDDMTTEIRDIHDFGASGTYLIMDGRYEFGTERFLFSINLSWGYNGFIDDSYSERILYNEVDVGMIKGDTDGEHWDVSLTFGGGFKILGLSLEMAPGFYYHRTDIDVDNGVVFDYTYGTEFPGGTIVNYSGDFFAFIIDWTLKFPVPFVPEERLWLKIGCRMFPYTYINTSLDHKYAQLKFKHHGGNFFNAWTVQISTLYYIVRSKSFSLAVELGYRNFFWRNTKLEEDTINTATGNSALRGQDVVDYVKIRQRGPFFGVIVEF